MIVEFIGSSGSGKTTVINRVKKYLLKRGFRVTTSKDMIVNATKTTFIHNDLYRNALQNILLFPSVINWALMNRNNMLFIIRHFAINYKKMVQTLSRALSLLRQIGSDDVIRRFRQREQIVLIDEGLISCLNNLFVYADRSPNERCVEEIAKIIPLPDLIIQLDTSVSVMLNRTQERPDAPRAIRRESDYMKTEFLKNGKKVFNLFSTQPRVQGIVITFINDTEAELTTTVKKVADMITHRMHAVINGLIR